MTQVAQHLNELNVRNTLDLTSQQLDEIEANVLASARPPLETLKWLCEQYCAMYDHIIENQDGQPNYQLVANFLQDAPEWNYELVEHFTHLASLQCEIV